jgi:S-disulfanyl-L-cysteine oxidoreductase SoxD
MKNFVLASVGVLALACSSTPPPASPEQPLQPAAETAPGTAPAAPTPPSASPTTFDDQVALGQQLYGANCASCHGDGGQGTATAPPVVGIDKGALPLDPPASAKYRKTQFKTVADIAAFVVKNMPPKAPGSLSEEQYWSILAFDLKANGIQLDKKLDGALAATLNVPRK